MRARLALLSIVLLPGSLAAQASFGWITETSVTWGRGGNAYQGTGSDAVTNRRPRHALDVSVGSGSDLAVSYGLRLAKRPALYSWLGAALLGLGAWAFTGELGCCS